ncbi:MAG: hypothetical protein A3J27_10505 [Candidatus Tectomicrobia bacterium RIFCSPLOWO2_12_FULL_69_37]|nr:MAG: hypothetical protein A3J27_10505 [Candidatus Tectomicrobia bacterium RIFCSPLOWO2_12_FULL_69_37]
MIRKEKMKDGGKVKVTFVLPRDQPHGKVSVVGDFNGWRPGEHVFARRANRAFSASVELEAGGRWAFRYLAEGGVWLDDEAPDAREADGNGNVNGVVET